MPAEATCRRFRCIPWLNLDGARRTELSTLRITVPPCMGCLRADSGTRSCFTHWDPPRSKFAFRTFETKSSSLKCWSCSAVPNYSTWSPLHVRDSRASRKSVLQTAQILPSATFCCGFANWSQTERASTPTSMRGHHRSPRFQHRALEWPSPHSSPAGCPRHTLSKCWFPRPGLANSQVGHRSCHY